MKIQKNFFTYQCRHNWSKNKARNGYHCNAISHREQCLVWVDQLLQSACVVLISQRGRGISVMCTVVAQKDFQVFNCWMMSTVLSMSSKVSCFASILLVFYQYSTPWVISAEATVSSSTGWSIASGFDLAWFSSLSSECYNMSSGTLNTTIPIPSWGDCDSSSRLLLHNEAC